MKLHPELITTADQIESLAEQLRQHHVIAFDTEFIREKTFYPQLEVLQVATGEDAWIIDAQAFPPVKSRGRTPIQPLLDIFGESEILKIVHAAQADQECLYTQYGIVASPILDTAIAASLCGLGESIGLAALLKSVLKVPLQKGYARTNWSSRPLPAHLAEYALADVAHLVELGRRMMERLDVMDRRPWALELSNQWADPTIYEPDPSQIATRLSKSGRITPKSFPVLLELLTWRERKVRELNIPRRWLADDDVLMSLAELQPKDYDHLKSFRGLNPRALKDDGKELLEAIEQGINAKGVRMPKFERSKPPSSEEARAIDLLRCYVELLSNRNHISSNKLVDSGTYLALLRSKHKDPAWWVEKSILSPFAAKLIGKEIAALLQGQRALTIEGTRINISKVEELEPVEQ